ncbi:hypothetical protein HYV87_03100 [Candidatus Woesearchaeota archaeon]|nr:hypothetical protein [Candidatus Woesearchaeota archaeon]
MTQDLKPNVVTVYAVETTRTKEDHVSRLGFGYSSPLEKPETTVTYDWQTQLHGQRPEVIGNGNTRESLSELAENLAMNVKANPSQPHNQAGIPAYSLSYQVERKEVEYGGSKSINKPLTPVEQLLFSGAFQKALRE